MNRAEKADLKDLHLLLIVLGVVICSAISFSAGKEIKQKEIENRASLYNMTVKENQTIEKVIFGEIQE